MAAAVLLAGPVRAQTLTGTVVGAEDAGPLEGAMVVLLDERDQPHGQGLTGPLGTFTLTAPAPGTWLVRIDRIGHGSVHSDPVTLAAGATVELVVEVPVAPIEIEGLDVEGARRCTVRPAEGVATAEVWEEARKALAAAQWTSDRAQYRFEMMSYVRDLGPNARVVQDQRTTFDRRVTGTPYQSAPAELLTQEGFVRPEGDVRIYHAPDAAVLLSDGFLDTHCFRLRRGEDEREGLVGLEFEPIRGRRLPDIRGTLWIDPEEWALRTLEYRYDNLGHPAGLSGGEVVFSGLPNGTWIVRDWRIRMPSLVQRVDAYGRSEIVVDGYRDQGGRVRRVTTREGAVVLQAEAGTLTGVVTDSLGRAPVRGARATLEGTEYEAVTGEDGTFRWGELPAGVYRLVVRHQVLDAVGATAEPVEVRIAEGEPASVRTRLPSLGDVLFERCRGEASESTAILAGRVVDDATGDPLSGARVRLDWNAFGIEGGSDPTGRTDPFLVREERSGLVLTTDEGGVYTACAVPDDDIVTVEAVLGDREGTEAVRIPWGVRGVVLEVRLPDG